MRKLFIILFLALISYPITLQAGIYGTLEGVVLDQDGKPVIGASVRILGTARGTYVKNPNGKFTVVNIDAGSYTVKVTAIGYKDYEIKGVRISADNISKIDATLMPEGVTTEEVLVVADRVMVNNTNIGQKRTMTSEEISSVAREGIASVIALTAGVVSTGGSYSIRGSRGGETKMKVDGIDVSNQFTGGGAGMPGMTEFDTEEIQVLTGGFSAEYGDAMGGIVNTVGKRGRTDKYDGYVRWRTDIDPLFGSQATGKKLIYNDAMDAFQAVASGDGAKLQGPGQHRFAFGTGGPIPGLTNSTFYVSSNYTYRKWNGASYEIYDPIGNNLGRMPDQQNWNKNLEGRLRFSIASGVELNIGASLGSINGEGSSSGWLYADDEGWIWDWKKSDWQRDANGNPVTNGIPVRIAQQTVGNAFNSKFYARINHTLSSTSYYEFTVSNSGIEEEGSKRVGWEDPGYFSGYDVWYPQDKYGVSGSILTEGKPNKIVDQYEIIKKTSLTVDGYNSYDFTQRNPLTGYIEGSADATGTANPYGRTNAYVQQGNASGLSFRKSDIWAFEGNFTKIFEGEFKHFIKTGFEFTYFTLDRHQNGLPWSGNPFFDVYTREWDGNFYSDSIGWAKTSKAFNPIKGSVYILDQIHYKGVIISPGLRFDMFVPGADYRTELDQFVSITADSGFASSDLKYQVSPRINVTYPITDRSNITINYGLFFQMPTLQYMFDGFATDRLRGNQILGDPNMEAQRTNAYEANYSNQLTDYFAMTIAAYYKDVYNQLGQVYVPAVPIPYFQYAVSEYGNIKGLEFTLQKRATMRDHIGMRFNYSLAQSVATSSSPGDNYLTPIDPYSALPAFPLSEFPTANDIRHRITFLLDLVWERNQGPSIGGIQPLENVNLNFTTTWQSGSPYTKTDLGGRAIGEIRTERGPDYWVTDMRLSKTLFFKDWFGDSWGNTAIELSLFVYNLFNLNHAVGLYTSTGDADDAGLSFRRKKGDFSSEPYYKNADFANASTLRSTQYDNYGNRLYNEFADTDNNEVVDQQEKFDAYMTQLETSVQFQGNYQRPRSVFLTVFFRF
ncbi:carboxypeptidase regulatory-like domain-containing protein [Bacteroidota bacterium]